MCDTEFYHQKYLGTMSRDGEKEDDQEITTLQKHAKSLGYRHTHRLRGLLRMGDGGKTCSDNFITSFKTK